MGIYDQWFFSLAEDSEFDGTYLWTVQQNGHYNSSVYKREIPSGKRIARFESSGKNASGIAFDPDNPKDFWITDTVLNTIECLRLKTITNVSQINEIQVNAHYPNPFNATTTIPYSIKFPSAVNISIHAINGQKIATLVDGPMSSGVHSVKFDGSKYASGVYFYRFESAGLTRTGKMLLLK